MPCPLYFVFNLLVFLCSYRLSSPLLVASESVSNVIEEQVWVNTDASMEAAPSAILPNTTVQRDYSDSAGKRLKWKVPSFERGGVVFFLHIPKTGGTTIRHNVEEVGRVQYVMAKNRTVYMDTFRLVEDAVVNGTDNSTVLFYEVHANTAPSFYQLRKKLRRWRDIARQHSVPVFFFTLLRDPVPYSFSHFNFFHVQKRNPSFEQCNATEENFLRLSLSNPQCQFLFKGEASMRAQKPTHVVVQPDECKDVHAEMFRLFDWVGVTERISNETLPLLSRLLSLEENSFQKRSKVSRDSGKTFERDNATELAIHTILDLSTLDSMLYTAAQELFRYDMLE